jgi:hypothetical protein
MEGQEAPMVISPSRLAALTRQIVVSLRRDREEGEK